MHAYAVRQLIRPLGLGLLTLVLAAGCSEGPEPAELEDRPEATPVTGSEYVHSAPRSEHAQSISERPATVIRHELRADAVDLFLDRMLQARPGSLPPELAVRMEPALPGTFTLQSRNVIRFEAEGGLPPDTPLEVAVEGPGISWSSTVHTPPLALQSTGLHRIDRRAREAEIELRFTGPVRTAGLLQAVRVRAEGRALPVRLAAQEDSGVVRISVHQVPAATRVLEVEVGEGVLSALADAASAPGTLQVALPADGPALEVLRAELVETSSGFAVDFTCHDAGDPNTRHWWDSAERRSRRISRRCLVEAAEAEARIRVSPEAPFTVSPIRNGFRLHPNLSQGKVTVRLEAGLAATQGGVLRESFEQTFEVPHRSPMVRFQAKGRYLPRSAWDRLAITHRNVQEVEVTVRRVPPENLVFWLSGPSEQADARTSEVVLRHTVALRGRPDEETTSFLDARALLPEQERGIYQVEVQAGQARDVSRILLTDLQLVAKAGTPPEDAAHAREIHAWALEATTLRPQRRVRIEAVRPSGQVMAACTTDRQGGCVLQVPEDPLDETPLLGLVARGAEDIATLRFDEVQLPLGEHAVDGEPYRNAAPYRAALYADRGVYRPGDTVRLAAVLRSDGMEPPSAEMPVEIRVTDPRGRLLRRESLRGNAAGMLTYDLPLQDHAPTGRYQVSLEVAGREVGALPLNVEEFVPERLRVSASAQADAAHREDPAPFEVEAAWLFGGAADNARVELSCTLHPASFRPARNHEWHFGPAPLETPRPVQVGTLTGRLDAEGRAAMSCPPPDRVGGLEGPARMMAAFSVFEGESGRTTQGTSSLPVHPTDRYLGLQTDADEIRSGRPLTVEGLLVDWQGDPLAEDGTAEVELLRLEHEWGWFWDWDGNERWQRGVRPVSDSRATVPIEGGRFRHVIEPRAGYAAGWLLRARSGEAVTEVRLEGDRWGWWWSDHRASVDQTPRPLRPTALELTTPDEVQVGEAAEVALVAPYPGRALLTVETDRLVKSEWVDLQAGPATWSFTLEDFAPNVYVSALLLKDPHLESPEAYLPDRAFAVASARVSPEDWRQPLTLTVPDEVRSNDLLPVTVDVGRGQGPTSVTIAAVDEGILSLTRHPDPDPLADLLPRRALDVATYETVGWSLPAPATGPSSRTGGDAVAEEPLGRVQMVRPVALWSGLVEVPESGRVTVELPVPQYRGALRVMAVSADPERIGNASTTVKVRDPLTLQTTLPRFLVQGDRAEVPVFLSNLTDQAQDVAIRLDAEGMGMAGPEAVSVVGPAEQTLALAPGASGTVVFQVRAEAGLGAARLRVRAEAGALLSEESLELPLSTDAPSRREVQRLALTDEGLDLAPHLAGWVPGTDVSTVWVTHNPYGEALAHLEGLLRYPHGCLEQTISTTRPLLLLSNLLPGLTPERVRDADDRVMHGINRVLGMQTASGGFGYWPGDTSPHFWGTAFAAHMLLDAANAGYEVPRERVDDALRWLDGEVARRGGQVRHWRHDEAYVHYVLALGGRGQKARLQREVAALGPANSSREYERSYLMKAALWHLGDRRYEQELRDPRPVDGRNIRGIREPFHSDLRTRGMVLAIHGDLFPDEREGGQALADQVFAFLRDGPAPSFTTQELTWGITGLGKRVRAATGDLSPSLQVDGREVAPAWSEPRTGEATFLVQGASARGALSLSLDGAGESNRYAIVQTEGLRQDDRWQFGGRGLVLQRSHLDAQGRPIDWSQHRLGDLVHARVRVQNTTREPIHHIALVDRIPAGWEIENPRLGRDQEVSWADPDLAWNADYLNLRDDRLEMFGTLQPGESREVIYVLRAVTAGTFTLPPVEAEAMYDPTRWARSPGRTIEIGGPWAEYLF